MDNAVRQRINQRAEDWGKLGHCWVWEEELGQTGNLVTYVQSMLVRLCPECHYSYCETIPVQAWAVDLIHCLGRYRCPQCGWVDGLKEVPNG